MLIINPEIKKHRTFIDRYEILVSRRVAYRYRMGSTMAMQVGGVITACDKRSFDVLTFVNSSFVFYREEMCQRLFKLKFPPVNALLFVKNMKAYEQHVLTMESFNKTKSVVSSPDRVYEREWARLIGVDFDSVLFCLSSGIVSRGTLLRAVKEGRLFGSCVDEAIKMVEGEIIC